MAEMTKIQSYLMNRQSMTYSTYYNGKMSYTLHGKEWEKYVAEAFPDLRDQQTSENIFKDVIDLYAINLVPAIDELRGLSNILVPLLARGEAPAIVDNTGAVHFPEHYEMVSDGRWSVAAIFTRSLEKMEDYVTFIDSSGATSLFAKPVPDGLAPATRDGYQFVETQANHRLFRFALDDRGFGPSMAALQDRVNHSILDQTVIAEMYARPFWYLLNTDLPVKNPYLPEATGYNDAAMREERTDGTSGRVFVSSSEGPFGQLEPPTIGDMIAYHDSIVSKVSQSTGIPEFFFKPGNQVPSGVALKVLSRRFNNKISRIREDLEPTLEELADHLGLERTVVVEGQAQNDYDFWPATDDLLQDALDIHGMNLATMGYPLEYIAEVVTPGVDLDDYVDDSLEEAMRLTPDQIAAYANNPGQRTDGPILNPIPGANPPSAQGVGG